MPKRYALEDLRTLRYAQAVREQLAIGRVANARGVQSSSISRRIRDLEDELGISLFERHTGGVRPTHAGEAFFAGLRAALAKLDETIAQAGAAGRGEIGSVRIGYVWPVATGPAKDLLTLQRERAPEVAITLCEKRATELTTGLLDRSIDVAFLVAQDVPPPLERWQLWSERLFFAISERAGLMSPMGWSILGERPLLVRTVDDWMVLQRMALRAGGPQFDVRVQECSGDGLLGLVAAGAGVAIVPESATSIPFPGVTFVPIDDNQAACTVFASWSVENANDAVRQFLALIKRTYRKPRRQLQK